MVMNKQIISYTFFIIAFTFCFTACKPKAVTETKEIKVEADEMNSAITTYINTVLADDKNFKLNDSTKLNNFLVLKLFYIKTEAAPIWSDDKKFKAVTNSFYNYLDNAILNGLFKEDYNFSLLKKLKSQLENDSLNLASQVVWGNTELLLTDALIGVMADLKQGRLQTDSFSWKKDSAKISSFFIPQINKIIAGENIDTVLQHLEPTHKGYLALKSGIKNFVDSMDRKLYTYVDYPYKDSLAFLKTLRKRLAESNINFSADPDSLELVDAIKSYQKKVGITIDGKVGAGMIKKLNSSDRQRLNVIAITLDKYKQLPAQMPKKYIWVNLPSYFMQVYDSDTLVLESKIIVGKQSTSTPLITSAISDIVLYPTWTVPTSIITKDMLPGLKRNPNYLARRGLYLLNGKGGRVNPYAVNWNKYTKGIPYRIQQASGDRNALGIIKFNFSNPFSVYLHDTNQRYLFKNGVRSLSHGCVRVQEWEKLANYLVQNDSLNLKQGDTLQFNTDSLKTWMAEKTNRVLVLKDRVPLYIRYFGCDLIDGRIKFFDDIYFEDRDLKQKYFAKK
jgi:L,D-transpeptidase YcbB